MVGRPGLAFPSLLFLAGTLVMLFLLILAGSHDHKPLNEIYFLKADTSGIPNAPDGDCLWTLYNYCESRNGKTHNCHHKSAAYPLDPVRNFHTKENVPPNFIHHRHRYYYLSRFLYAFYLITLFFTLLAFLAGLLALCSRLGGAVSAVFAAVAFVCMVFSACVMTSCYVLGKNAFRDAGRFAKVGVKAFALTWTCTFLLGLTTVLFCLSCLSGRRHRRNQNQAYPTISNTYSTNNNNNIIGPYTTTTVTNDTILRNGGNAKKTGFAGVLGFVASRIMGRGKNRNGVVESEDERRFRKEIQGDGMGEYGNGHHGGSGGDAYEERDTYVGGGRGYRGVEH